MAKVTRKPLARGVKLLPAHTHGVLVDVATEINAGTVSSDQMVKNWVPFRINIPMAYVDSTYCHTPNKQHLIAVPFTLMPVQNEFGVTTSLIGTITPNPGAQPVVLDEVSFSFDQRGEPAAIADWMHKGLNTAWVDTAGAEPAVGDKFVINGVEFTASATASPSAQQFLDIATAGNTVACVASMIATVNDPASQNLIRKSNDDGAYAIATTDGTYANRMNLKASRAQGSIVGFPSFTLAESTSAARMAVSGAIFTLANAQMNSTEGGKLDYDTSGLALKLSILEKTPWYFDPSVILPEREVVAIDLPAEAFSGRALRLNPYVLSGIQARLDPYKTYIVTLDVSSLRQYDADTDLISYWKTYCLPSVLISLKCRTPLTTRDVNTANSIANMPGHNGNPVPTSQPLTALVTQPTAGAAITADTGGSNRGLSQSMAAVDEYIRNKYDAGYDAHSGIPVYEGITEDAGYEIITVPLYQNRQNGGVIANQVTDEPFNSAAADDNLWDRRLIPIISPLVVHHVTLAWNWSDYEQVISPKAISGLSNSTNLQMECVVGILTGNRADDYDYHQIASLTTIADPTDATWDTQLVDRIGINGVHDIAQKAGGTGHRWSWEIHQLQMAGTGGTGYITQGVPCFVGGGLGRMSSTVRSNISGVAPRTAGAEQWLEVRIRLSDSLGLKTTANGGNQTDGSLLIGYGGCYAYLHCKKHLCDGSY